MKITLGTLEQAILPACLMHQRADKNSYDPDLYRDELPALLWGWQGQHTRRRAGQRSP
jgi:hypothetical protein